MFLEVGSRMSGDTTDQAACMNTDLKGQLSSLCSLPVVCVCIRERICLCEIKGERFVCVCKRERKKEKEGELEICYGDQELEKQKVKQT